jgi:hypothetical protein
MANNKDYYQRLISDDDHPNEIVSALFRGNFEPYLSYMNRQGCDKIGVTLDAIGNFYGVDFELYGNSFVPFYVKCCNNRVTLDQPIRM